MDAETVSYYEFGPFRLDCARRRLLKDDAPVPLTPKAFETLLLLVQHSGRTLEKEELLRCVWPGTIVEENNLTQAISRLRKALGDSLDEHRYIVTLPGQGYRFVAPVREVAVEAEMLAARLSRGALPFAEAVEIALALLAALEKVHSQGRVHGCLAPAAVLVVGNNVRLLEGRPVSGSHSEDTHAYQSPEQVLGHPARPGSDIFAAGAMLFEMLTGNSPFGRSSFDQVRHAITSTTTPVLGGSRAVAAVDRIIHRALAKTPDERYQTARAMADDLREAWLMADADEPPRIHPVTRLIVVPFRALRPDPDTDFLTFSLPDAITSSLTGLESLIVRSNLSAARFANETPDLEAIASHADVDLVLTGTLLRSGDELRVNTQLVQVPGGTVIWSQMSNVPLANIFHVQDEIAWRIVESLPVSPTARDARLLKRDVPASARAYEFYLRANQLSYDPAHWIVARDLYRQSVEEDSRYAPAWARLGRIYRVIGIYSGEDAEANFRLSQDAFRRALQINPDLPLAHNLYTYLEVESGGATQAMLRLIERAKGCTGDPELFAGLVHACRYCGLLDAAVAAYQQARRLDPHIRTSVAHAYWMLGEHEKAIETDLEKPRLTTIAALISMGREAEALAGLKAMEPLDLPNSMHHYVVALRAGLEGKRAECLDATERILESWRVRDPCARFYVARHLANVGDTERALTNLQTAVESGFFCYSALARDPWLDSLRGSVEFATILRRAETGHREARAAFLQAGGDQVLGLTRS